MLPVDILSLLRDWWKERPTGQDKDVPAPERAWIQTSSATVDLKAAISSAMASAGVLQPSVFLGRLFIRAAMSLSQVWLTSPRSVPFGMNWRSKPLVFSFEPRCHALPGNRCLQR